MIYEYLLLVVLIALWKRGSFKRLAQTDIRQPFLIIASLLMQIAAMSLYHRVEWMAQTFTIWIVLSYALLSYCCWLNRRLPGFLLFGIGMALNFIVITANGGRMPVSVDALQWAGLSSYIPLLQEGITKHQAMTDATRLPLLGDIIPLRPPFVFSRMVVSVGDVAATCGISWFFYKRMTQ
ncbi:DUF5317 domain-containing protein [Brevibacillus sp. SYP-B805]|uniref:DUF5317 domain-containing protein n=1 Tax=Brevibacillus sp. SYP-B805 TaxID=1578199 RepID=UPI0013EE285C|nr:DUF5317 domain-containing protein [Brevibacillus sp. SYP-B805]NGQ94907.1 DUF5317 domain-containing protein [Brevibacillus sp. SYP-B805]